MGGFDHRPALAREALNALQASIAVLDARGVIVAVNQAWIRFARANGSTDPHFYLGANYLNICEESAAGVNDERLNETIRRVRGLLEGREQHYESEYPCDSPTEKRWFSLKATRLTESGPGGVVIAHEDITERKSIQHALQEAERKLRLVLEALPVGVWIMDREGRIVHGNPEAQRIWVGARYVAPEQFSEYKAWWVSTGQPIAPDEWAASRAMSRGETSIGEEIEIECFDGTHKFILNSALPLFDENQIPQGAIIVNQDITERKNAENTLRRMKDELELAGRELSDALARERVLSRIDPLTGRTNRRHFFDLAALEFSVAVRYGHPLALVIFDIDEFKKINDTFGHQAGDQLLRRVSEIAGTHLRDADVFARYGGDEFVILLPHTREAEAVIVAERIRRDLSAESMVLERGAMTVTISSGVTELIPPDDTVNALIHRADLALYDAKNSGRNRTAVFARTPPASGDASAGSSATP